MLTQFFIGAVFTKTIPFSFSIILVTFASRNIIKEKRTMIRSISTILVGLFLMYSCGEKVSPENAPELQKSTGIAPNEFDDLMANIDMQIDSLAVMQSLLYTKDENTMMDVTAYLDKNEAITKIVEYYQDGKTGIVSRKHYYFNGGAKYATKWVHEVQPAGGKPYYSEIVTFYDKNQKPTSSKERKADFEENLEQSEFHKAKILDLTVDNAYKVLNQEDEYSITFQGFADAGQYSFLIVGANDPNGYTSSLSIQQNSPTLLSLKAQGEKALGTPLSVNFVRMVDQQGYEMQILNDVQFAEKSK